MLILQGKVHECGVFYARNTGFNDHNNSFIHKIHFKAQQPYFILIRSVFKVSQEDDVKRITNTKSHCFFSKWQSNKINNAKYYVELE